MGEDFSLACSVTIHSLNFGKSSLTSDMRGLVLTVNSISLSVSTNWMFEEADWYAYCFE